MPGPLRLNEKRRYLHIVFFVFALLILTHIAELFTARYYESHSEELARSKADRLLEEASQRFVSIQRETRRITTDLARNPVISSYLEGKSVELSPLFREVVALGREQRVGIEVFDERGSLIAWTGASGPINSGEIHLALQGILSSYIIPTALYSQLFVATPVRSDTRITGVVLVRTIVDTHYPLSNRFVSREGLSATLLRELGIPVRFEFSRENAETHSGFVTAPLYGIDSTRVGFVSVPVPTGSAFLEEVGKSFDYAQGALYLTLLILLLVLVWRRIREIENLILKSVVLTALIWLTRYTLLWLDLPVLYFPGGIFDPVFYATTFGSGVAKSIGELTLTSVALLINTLMIVSFVVRSETASLRMKFLRFRAARWGMALVMVILFFLLLRAYGVIIRSAVFDSALQYNDPAVIIPSFELAVMVVNLFTISLCIVIVLAGLLLCVVRLLSAIPAEQGRTFAGWIFTAGMLVAGVIMVEVLRSTNLMTWEYRAPTDLSALREACAAGCLCSARGELS